MRSIVRSELTKITTLRSVRIVTGILLALGLYFQYQSYEGIRDALASLDEHGMHWWYGRPVPADLDVLAGVNSAVFSPGVFFPVLGACIAGAEFRHGHLGVSVLAVPDRVRLIAGKTIATAWYALGFGLVLAVMSALSTYAAVKDWQPGLIVRPEALVGLSGAVLFVIVITLISFAMTLITRRTILGILIMSGFIAITVTQVFATISPTLDALTPMSAVRNMLLQDIDLGLGGPGFTSSPASAALVLAAWVVVTLVGAAFAIERRDAR